MLVLKRGVDVLAYLVGLLVPALVYILIKERCKDTHYLLSFSMLNPTIFQDTKSMFAAGVDSYPWP